MTSSKRVPSSSLAQKYKLFLILLMISLSACSSAPKPKSTVGNEPQTQPPSLNQAEIRTIWIPDTIEDDKFIEGHFVHIIERQATWKKER